MDNKMGNLIFWGVCCIWPQIVAFIEFAIVWFIRGGRLHLFRRQGRVE